MSEISSYLDSDGINVTEWNVPPHVKYSEYFKQVENIFAANGKKILDSSTIFESGVDPSTGKREKPDKNIFIIKWTLK